MINKAAVFLLLSLCVWLQPVQAAIPSSERDALIALYNATDGANWNNNTEWLGAVGTECSWFGVSCVNEHVIVIGLSSNNLSGTIPAQLGQLSHLQELWLSWNQLTGAIPAELGQLSNLEILCLYWNQLTGTIPAQLGQLSQLHWLYLYWNQLTGAIPAELGQLSHLEAIRMSGNQLTGAIPAELGQLSNLWMLDLSWNQLSGAIPAQLGQLSQFHTLWLSGNQLTGAIPAELGQLSNLQELWLSGNQLTGAIPAQLGQLSLLQRLDLSGNQLTGAIPAQLGQLSQLQWLYLYDNQLTGTIPAQLGQLSHLGDLRLSGNQLTGTIPAQLGQLGQMSSNLVIELSSNQLTGVPLQITQFYGSFSVAHNCLIPATLELAVVSFLDQHDPHWREQNSVCSVMPTVTPPTIRQGTNLDAKNLFYFDVALTESLPEGFGVFLNFDNLQGGWLNQTDPGGHLQLIAQGGGVYSVDYELQHPGIRSFRAGIFYSNGNLVGSYSASATCTLPVCINAIAPPNAFGDPAVTGSGSQLFKNVDVSNGNYHLSVTDMVVDGKGPAFAFTRAYNSLALNPWTFGYEAKAAFLAGTYNRQIAIGPREEGHVQYFYKDMDDLWYALNPGNFDQLIENTDGSFVLYTQGNRLYRFTKPLSTMPGRLHSIEDRLGNALTFNYSGNNLIGATDANARAYIISRDANNRIRRVTDFTNRYVEYTYDTNGMITDVRTMRGYNHQYSYVGATGFDSYRLASITDPRGHVQMNIEYLEVAFTAFGKNDIQVRVVALTNGMGEVTEFSYPFINTVSSPFYLKEATAIKQPTVDGVNNNVAFILDNQRTRVETRLDTINAPEYVRTQRYKALQDRQHLAETGLTDQVVEGLDPKKNTTTISYDDVARNRPAKVTDAEGNDHLSGYTKIPDTHNLTAMTSSQQPGVASTTQFKDFTSKTGQAGTIIDPLNHITSRNFDPDNNYWLTQVTDPKGIATQYSYDVFGHVVTTISAQERRTDRSYDNLGRVSEEISPTDLHTLYIYDELGNVLTKTEQATGGINYTTQNDYDASDNLSWTIDPRGHRTDYSYDVLNRKTEERYLVTGVQHSRLYSYDAMGRLKAVKNERGQVSSTKYDARSQVTKKINPLNQTTVVYTYDANGNVATVTDGENRTVTYSYDAVNRKTREQDSQGNYQKWIYTPNGKVASQRDWRGKLTQYNYDAVGNVKQTNEAGAISTATYDKNDNMESVTDANGHTTTYLNNASNQLVTTTLHDGQHWLYNYDFGGNLISEITPTGEETVQVFDALNRLKQRTEYAANRSITRQISYSHDANGNVTSVSSGGNTISYGYDEINRISSVTDQYGKTLSYAYDKAGNRTGLTYPGNKTIVYNYDNADRLLSLTDWLNKTTSYTRNQAGQVTDVVNGNSTKTHYGYDAAGRLIQLKNLQANNSVLSSHDLTLDGAGNITQSTVGLPLKPALPPSISSMSYDNTNRLLKAGGNTYSHDLSGRIVQTAVNGTQTIYNFDINDHISKITRGGSTLSQYAYDLNDNRISQTQSGTEKRYVIDALASLPNVVAETNAQGAIGRYYLYGEGLVSQIDASGNSHYYHYDPTGHTLALTDANGNISDKYAYTPYGHTTAQGSTPNPFKFVGKHGVMDDGNGLHYMRARYYKEDIMRFMSLDALHGDMLTPQALNRYAYVLGNPVMGIDPSGLAPLLKYYVTNIYKLPGHILEANKKMVEGSIKYAFNEIILEPYRETVADCKDSNVRFNDGSFTGKANTFSFCFKNAMDNIVGSTLTAISPTTVLAAVLSVNIDLITDNKEDAEKYMSNVETAISVVSLSYGAKDLQKQINQANGSLSAMRSILGKVNDKRGLAMVKNNLLIHVKEILLSLNDLLDAVKKTTEY